MRLIIAGSRKGVKYSHLLQALEEVFKTPEMQRAVAENGVISCVVCGMAEGAVVS